VRGQSSPSATHLIKVACQATLGQRPAIEIFGRDYETPDETCVRDYIHVCDFLCCQGAQEMRSNLFWLNDTQWQLIEPHLPTDVRGKERVNDRRVISGILHVLKSGCRWKDCPPEYGPPTTVCNRFHISVRQLQADIRTFIDRHNENPKSFKWVKSAD